MLPYTLRLRDKGENLSHSGGPQSRDDALSLQVESVKVVGALVSGMS